MEIDADDKGNIRVIASGKYAVETSGQVATAYIHTRLVMRIGLYVLAVIMVVAACAFVVFAPDGREHMAIYIGIALVVVAIAVAGFASFQFRAPGGVSIEGKAE